MEATEVDALVAIVQHHLPKDLEGIAYDHLVRGRVGVGARVRVGVRVRVRARVRVRVRVRVRLRCLC